MPSDDRSSEFADDRDSESRDDRTSESDDGDTSASGDSSVDESPDATVDASLPEGFGEPAPDREASRWGGYALAGLLVVVFLIGLVRLAYPTASVMVVGTLLALFGVLVGALAVAGRLRGS